MFQKIIKFFKEKIFLLQLFDFFASGWVVRSRLSAKPRFCQPIHFPIDILCSHQRNPDDDYRAEMLRWIPFSRKNEACFSFFRLQPAKEEAHTFIKALSSQKSKILQATPISFGLLLTFYPKRNPIFFSTLLSNFWWRPCMSAQIFFIGAYVSICYDHQQNGLLKLSWCKADFLFFLFSTHYFLWTAKADWTRVSFF